MNISIVTFNIVKGEYTMNALQVGFFVYSTG